MSEDMGCHAAARIAPGRALLHRYARRGNAALRDDGGSAGGDVLSEGIGAGKAEALALHSIQHASQPALFLLGIDALRVHQLAVFILHLGFVQAEALQQPVHDLLGIGIVVDPGKLLERRDLRISAVKGIGLGIRNRQFIDPLLPALLQQLHQRENDLILGLSGQEGLVQYNIHAHPIGDNGIAVPVGDLTPGRFHGLGFDGALVDLAFVFIALDQLHLQHPSDEKYQHQSKGQYQDIIPFFQKCRHRVSSLRSPRCGG